MERDSVSAKRKTIDLDKGVYVIRYATAEDHVSHPSVNVAVDEDDLDSISFILQRDAKDAVLWQPGSGIAVRAMQSGRLHVEIVPSHASGSAAATIKIEPLTQGANAFLPVDQEREASSGQLANFDEFRTLGHLAGRGDVFVGMDEWLGGPTAPTRIEGVALEWPRKPRGLDLSYSVKMGHPGGASSPMVRLGTFAGTRGRALPVVELTLDLSGADAHLHQFAAEAIFLGSPLLRVAGQRITLAGPTGYEPLVGLRLKVEPKRMSSRQESQKTEFGSQKSGHVRVFRSRNKASFA